MLLATVMPELGSPDDLPASAAVLRARRWRGAARPAVVVGLIVALVAGCSKDDPAQLKAYEDAKAAVERERTTLRSMEAERNRLYGEYLLHRLESQVWGGEFAPTKAFGLDLGKNFGSDLPLTRFYYRKWPHGWCGQMDRLLSRSADLLPWYERYEAESYRRRLTDRYTKLLNDLRDRVSVQSDRVRNAEDYARILMPPNAAK